MEEERFARTNAGFVDHEEMLDLNCLPMVRVAYVEIDLGLFFLFFFVFVSLR